MRKFIKKILKWFLHEHEYEILYRIITYKEEPIENPKKNEKNWKERYWIKIIFAKKCKTCGHEKREKIDRFK